MQNNTNNSDWRSVLKYEFEGGEGSFMLQIRCGPGWDKEAYLRLFNAMLECCKAHDFYPRYNLERSENKTDYYANAVTNFNHLAFWLFAGEGRADNEFEPI